MMWVYFIDTNMFHVEELINIPQEFNRNDIRMTLDYEDDLIFFQSVVQSFDNENFTLHDIVKFLDDNPQIIKINYYLHERWKQNQLAKISMSIK